ncbi:hypothetical protein LF887_09105 [Chryseobacterium sp. MEBOG06]|uniref:hypothetical protein n=1 Tax=Chryseobacterium sp. MEBOG06 TaxID=2879938 RepID=UPI001F28B2E6|nr:hypothetical protein [Chryseobacterium sp. MEBOG06]UKB85760.1 hypothetical protein LF887_09105 [Chryseobacterium sp. MEBOG06]
MNLSKLNVQELSTNEMKKTEGGFFGPFRAGLTLAYRNWLAQNGGGTYNGSDYGWGGIH